MSTLPSGGPAGASFAARFAAALSKITIRITSRWRLAGLGCRLPGTREIAAPGASICRATSMLAVIFASLPEGIVRAALRCPVFQRTGSPRVSVAYTRSGYAAQSPPRAGMTWVRSWGNTPDGTFVPGISEPDVIGS